LNYKHTPGPWFRGYGNFIYRDERKISLLATFCPPNGDRGELEEAFANATLCSAAPDLLEVCKMVHEANSFSSIDWRMLERAIQKAEGN